MLILHSCPASPRQFSNPGNARVHRLGDVCVDANHLLLRCQYAEAPGLIEQHGRSFDRGWAHLEELAQ
jgi:hypothetical protein